MRNVLALGYGQASRTLLQLASVPVFTYFWGLHDYGIWLLLFTVPTFLAMGDLGFNTAASNAIIVAFERGNEREGAEVFSATRLTVMAIAGVLLALTVATLLLAPHLVAWIADGGSPAIPTAIAVLVYGLICLQSATTLAGFRATGGYAEAVFIVETTFVTETLAALGTVALGGSLLQCALAYLFVRTLGAAIAAMLLRRHAPALFAAGERNYGSVMKELSGPALAVMAIPISNALSLQGAVAVIGAVAGPAVVPIFTATRTLSRLPVQLTMVVVHASAPLITAANARGDRDRLDNLIGAVFTFSTPVLAVLLAALAIAGRWVVEVWTHGQIQPSSALLALLLMSAFVYSYWLILSNFVLAINRQASYSYVFLSASVASLAITAGFVRTWGIEGAALAALLLDLTMLAWLVRCTWRLDLVGGHTFRRLFSLHSLGQWRSLIGDR